MEKITLSELQLIYDFKPKILNSINLKPFETIWLSNK